MELDASWARKHVGRRTPWQSTCLYLSIACGPGGARGHGAGPQGWGAPTGKEVHSVAMVLEENAITPDAPPQLQVFATDIPAGVDPGETRS